MDAIKLLKEQHDDVKTLFEEFEKSDDVEERGNIVQEIADSLAAHATIEERIFYPAAYAQETRERLTEAVEEHLAMKRIVADLLGMRPEDDNFDAKLEVLQEQVEHHVEEEEGGLFKAARRFLEAEELEQLGVSMEALYESEMEKDPSESVPQQTDEAAPLRPTPHASGRASRQ